MGVTYTYTYINIYAYGGCVSCKNLAMKYKTAYATLHV